MPSESVWFLTNLVEIHLSAVDDQPALLEVTVPAGDMPPLHAHLDEPETFYVLDGSLEVWVGDAAPLLLSPGEATRAPSGIPHTYRAGSDGARFLVSAGRRFEGFVRAAGRPAPERVLPVPTPPDPDELGRLAAAARIELLGPPGALPADLATVGAQSGV